MRKFFESSFRRFSANINSTIDFCNSWHYLFTRAPKQLQSPSYFSELASEKLNIALEILIVEIHPVLLKKNSLTIGKSR